MLTPGEKKLMPGWVTRPAIIASGTLTLTLTITLKQTNKQTNKQNNINTNYMFFLGVMV